MELRCQNLSKEYASANGKVKALANIDFTITDQTFLGIVGPSGCGKTTLLKIIAGLSTPSSGTVSFGPHSQNGTPKNAMVFQEHGLLPWLSVRDNIALGLELRGVDKKERRTKADAFITQVGLTDFAGSYPGQLSIGMCQRAAIARAFLTDPRILLMDEPFSALDAQSRSLLQQELLRIWRDHRKTVIFVTHDIEEAILLSDRVLVMSGRPGRILEDIAIPIDRPRTMHAMDSPESGRIKWQIWGMLESEIKHQLEMG